MAEVTVFLERLYKTVAEISDSNSTKIEVESNIRYYLELPKEDVYLVRRRLANISKSVLFSIYRPTTDSLF